MYTFYRKILFLRLHTLHELECFLIKSVVIQPKYTTRMHSSRMRIGRSSSHLGGLHQAPWEQAPPRDQTLPLSIPPRTRPPPPDQAPAPDQAPLGPDPPRPGTPQDQAPPPVNRMTNRCKNITLPQTSFAGGKKRKSRFVHLCRSNTYRKPKITISEVCPDSSALAKKIK